MSKPIDLVIRILVICWGRVMAHINVSKYFLFCGTIASVQAMEQVLVVTEYYGESWSCSKV